VEGWFALVLCTFKCFHHDNQILDHIHLFTRLYKIEILIVRDKSLRHTHYRKQNFGGSYLKDSQLLEAAIAALRAKLQRG
jgi:hypothetical protein